MINFFLYFKKTSINANNDAAEDSAKNQDSFKRQSRRRDKKSTSSESVDESQASQFSGFIEVSASSGGDDTTVIMMDKSTKEIEKPLEQTQQDELMDVSYNCPPIENEIVKKESDVPETITNEENRSEIIPTAQEPVINPFTYATVIKTSSDKITEENINDITPQFLDDSVISVADTTPPTEQKPKDATFSPIVSSNQPIKDSTFSPVVDTSINDSRPTIEPFNESPVAAKSVPLRTSTPLFQRAILNNGFGTPKRSTPASSSLAKVLNSKFAAKIDNAVLDETLGGQFKMVNPLEKSILKSSRRKRSMSVADCENFAQKRVMFISPKVMDICEIDEKMMASFLEEKENSMMLQAASSARRRRSMSTGTPAKPKVTARSKMPNFKAIHEQQFKKMESIADHANRKAERAKKLTTPIRDKIEAKVPSSLTPVREIAQARVTKKLIEIQAENEAKSTKLSIQNQNKPDVKASTMTKPTHEKAAEKSSKPTSQDKTVETSSKTISFSKIPTFTQRKPLVKAPSTENVTKISSSRRLKRSQSSYIDEPAKKKLQMDSTPFGNEKKIAIVNGFQRSNSENVKSESTWTAPQLITSALLGINKHPVATTSTQTNSQKNHKVEDRREKNMSMYKKNQIQKSTVDHRQQNNNLLKGVRLNKRFELQMQYRREHEDAQ